MTSLIRTVSSCVCSTTVYYGFLKEGMIAFNSGEWKKAERKTQILNLKGQMGVWPGMRPVILVAEEWKNLMVILKSSKFVLRYNGFKVLEGFYKSNKSGKHFRKGKEFVGLWLKEDTWNTAIHVGQRHWEPELDRNARNKDQRSDWKTVYRIDKELVNVSDWT